MICPLCEHVQPEGDACDVCGRALEGRGAAAVAIPAIEGLEPTAQPAAGPLDIAPLAELEPTVASASASAAGPAPDTFLELEPTRAPAVEIAAEPVPDLEPTASAPDDARTPIPASATCRYCRTPAQPGEKRCARCGMRLPIALGSREARADDAAAGHPCSCGALVTGAICPACGARIVGPV